MNRRPGLLDTLSYAVLIVGAIAMVAPFVLMLLTSLMTYEQASAYPPTWWPHPATLLHYSRTLGETPILRYALNSLVVAVCAVIGQVLTGSLAGYALARFRFRGRDWAFYAVMATMLVPAYVNIVPLFAMMSLIGWIDSYQALILPGLAGAYGVFLFRQWFARFPQDLEDAARLDGCSPWAIYWRIALPTAWPAIAALGILEFLGSWNTFFWPLVATNSDALRTLPVGLASFKAGMAEVTDWGLLMAATAIAVLPPIVVFALGQRFFVKGMLDGALKH